ncbi:MAG TPA: DNA-3-methyladenine glycosylase [Terriglobia bacterium]|nr:DNA-3-methyladenine glycosylase [Terriglobia bacterium]
MILHPAEPFDFRRTLRFILSPPVLANGRRFEPLLDHFEEGEYRRAAEIEGKLVIYGVSENLSDSSPALRVRILSDGRDSRPLEAVAALVRRQLALDLDLLPFYRLGSSDPVLARLAIHFRGMRIPQVANPYEALVSAILEQQVNLSFAHQAKRALIERYGRVTEYGGRSYRLFPSPEAIARATPQELRRLQISGPKARYIIGISSAVTKGDLDLESLRTMGSAPAIERLCALKGVGDWTAHYVAMRALGHCDCLPAADVGLQKSVQFFYGLRQQPPPARVEKLARHWTGWRSYATFYLWLTYWEDTSWRLALRDEIRRSRKAALP